MSVASRPVLGEDVRREELTPQLAEVVDEGWFELDGAYLLKAWHASYHGPRFDDTSYEIAVNGRGIPDLDLTEIGAARAKRLLERGIAFARAALSRARDAIPHVEMYAYVSAAPVLCDPAQITGHVTFCTDGRYIRPDIDDMVVQL
jgi:hypothetical protein